VRRRDGTHHDHSLETETDVAVRRLFASAGDRCVTIGWDYPGRTLLEVRILRSGGRAAAGPDDTGPARVYEDVSGSFRDDGLENGRAYVYSVFARHPGGEWLRWDDLKLTPASARDSDPISDARGEKGRATTSASGLFALVVGALLLMAAVAVALGAVPALAEDGTEGDGQEVDGKRVATAAQVFSWKAALADPVVVSLLEGRQPTSSALDVDLWSPSSDVAGATVYLLWPDGPGVDIDAELPVARRRDPEQPPPAPFEIVMHRVRASDVTGLRVLVDLADNSVLEVYPWDEHADYALHEDTTAPFSWVPWVTANAWVLVPVFAAAALYLGIRSWLRSRAWRRRLPSMSRHDRQFMGRIVVALLMMAAVVVMAVAVWRAVTVPILDPDRLVGGDLATWPLVLFPPFLYLAAIGLEVTGAPHRVAWSMVAVISGVSFVYSLVAMQQATVTNVTLLYYVLLGCLALVAIPRAFSPGKLGWSRNQGRGEA
jgi:hypothetical protein